MNLQLRFYGESFTVCQLPDVSAVDLSRPLYFLSKTAEEVSLVCPSDCVPANAVKSESGWSMFRIEGQLDFGLIGILAEITSLLAGKGISVFAVSTFNTDYVLVKSDRFTEARSLLEAAGCECI